MKKTEKFTFALITLLAIGLVVSIVQMRNLRWQLENTRQELHHVSSNLSFQVNSIFSQVDERFNRQLSQIELASTQITGIDVGNRTADITFTLTPKQVSPNTAVSLNLGGEVVPMQRHEQLFTVTVPHSIFSDIRPIILINEDGTISTTQDSRIGMWSIMHEIFPTMRPSFSGSSTHGGGRLRINGNINTSFEQLQSSPVSFVDLHLVTSIGGVVTDRTQIPLDQAANWPLDKSIPLADNQELVLTMVATDSIGLEHHVTVWTTNRSVPGVLAIHGHGLDLRIFEPDGILLWQRELFGFY